ncbi:acyl-CoA dehydrogenase family protein [Gordonia polyisoprenivorans]|uniref:acyl-CoA dehydrogenase family protein n=1 Tax=Gordonia polyisoprenivorans TaxID=84595 RepID=UPI001F0AE44F|nr:acyl-CoA dehydrogenase family protein [Gordonia polyisoprenivorans]
MSAPGQTTTPPTPSMTADLQYSDTEEALRDSVRRLFADRLPADVVVKAYESDAPDFSQVWRTLAADLGLAALLIPESLGGAGASEREAAVVCEEIGRAVAPVPFLSSAIIATAVLLHAGDTELLPQLAEGTTTAALAVGLSATHPRPSVTVGPDGAVSGRVTTVAGATDADVLIVPAGGADGVELYAVRADSPGVTVTPALGLDMTRPPADLEFTDALGRRVGSGDGGDAVQAALLTGVALLASEQLGVAQWCLQTTLTYVKERRQFGRQIGSYQAIKHRLADLWLEVSSAGAAARYAADTAARRDADAEIAAHLAASYCGDVAVRAAEECIQLHGGIGMTWEYPAHLYLKRAKADQLALGNGYQHRARLAELVALAPSSSWR